MDEPQYLLQMELLLQQLQEEEDNCDAGGSDFCPPPFFDLPPPPPPPWLDIKPNDCRGTSGCNSAPTAVVSSIDNVQEIVHSISIIVVSSLVIVITVLFAAVIIWRRRQMFQRKFGSCSVLPSDVDQRSQEKSGKHHEPGALRTLPNHYTSDHLNLHQHQVAVDVNGRAVLTSNATPIDNAMNVNQPSTLIIGGVPFHIQQTQHGAMMSSKVPANTAAGCGMAAQPATAILYPVYETIESDYGEKSSVYSDREQSLTYTNVAAPIIATTDGNHPSAPMSFNSVAGQGRNSNQWRSEQRLFQCNSTGSELSGYFVYHPAPVNSGSPQHILPQLHRQPPPSSLGQCVAGTVESRQERRTSGGGAPRRTQSYRSGTAALITRTPLPPIPRSMAATPTTVQSSISLETCISSNSSSPAPVTQL